MSQSQRQFDQPMEGQTGQRGQYQQPPTGLGGGGQAGGGIQQPASSGTMGSGQTAGGGMGAGGGRQALRFPTQNYLPEDVRVPIAETLNRVLADTTVLYTHAKFAHWNLKGPEFYALHLLFDEVAETFEGHADQVAERITALGAQAMGTAGMAVENCSLPQMPADVVSGVEYVELLADRVAIHDANLYDAIQTAQGYGDPDTADLLNEISREVSQQLWFLEAHLQTQPVGTIGAGGDVGQGQAVGRQQGGLEQQGLGQQQGTVQQQGSFQR